jgi:hypothetical protein
MDVLQSLGNCYGLVLKLFPIAYREEYGDELLSVFNLSMNDAMGKGQVVKVFLRELIGLPQAVVLEHLRERRKKKMAGKFASRFDFEPGSRNEMLAALAPFLLFGAVPVLFSYLDTRGIIPQWFAITFVILFWFLGLGLFVIGFKHQVPRWFMPYLGLPLPVVSILLFNWLPEFPALFRRLYDISWFSGAFVFGGLILMGVPFSVILLVLITRIIPKFAPFYQRLREDWAVVCFLLYGCIPFILVMLFEEFKGEEPYMFLGLLVLAAGAWLYLKSDTDWKKFMSLFGSMTLSMLITMAGQAVLYDSSFPATSFPVWTTTMSTVIAWIWLTLFMLSPLALDRISLMKNHQNQVVS